MLESDRLKPREKIEFQISQGETKLSLTARVIAIDERGIYISKPRLDKDNPLAVEVGQDVAVIYRRQTNTIRFETKIFSEGYAGRKPTLALEHPRKYEFERLSPTIRIGSGQLRVEYRSRDINPNLKAVAMPFMVGSITELSPEGVIFKVPAVDCQSLARGDKLVIRLELMGNSAEIDAQLINVRSNQDDPATRLIECSFSRLTAKHQGLIIDHNIDFQRDSGA